MEDTTQDLNLTFSGCGFLGIYHIGVMSCLKENAPGFLRRVKCFGGASAGAFAAVGLVVDLDISEVAESVIRLGKRANSLSFGPFHPSFQIVRTVRRAFEKMLPDNAHELASGRLHISLTHVGIRGFTNVIISEFYSKEDLIEALVASSFVPLYSGIFPAVFRGKYYVDGGISDNLPQHFKEGETITVSPFSGEHDICPKDVSSNDVHIELRNLSMQFTNKNLWRLSHAFLPPDETGLSDICRQGYRDTLRFLKEHYPDTLTKESLTTASMSLNLPPPHCNSTASCQKTSSSRKTSCSSAISSRPSCGCSDHEMEVFSGPENEKVPTEVEEGESKLSMLLLRANEAVAEGELWSCFLFRRSFNVFKVLATPCAITIRQVLGMLKIFLESLTKVEKTGNQFFDELLSVITTVLHTYQDKHQVQHWKSEFAVTAHGRNNEHAMVMDPGADNNDVTFTCILNTSALCRELQECLAESMVMMEHHVGESYAETNSDSNNNSSDIVKDLGGSACAGAESLVVDNCDNYVILNGFELH